MTDGSTTWTYTYNADGLRTKRTNGSTTYSYVYNGSSLTQMTVGSDTLYFAYDASGTPISVTCNGIKYYYMTNIQGDVLVILSGEGKIMVEYTYDAWGNILDITGLMASTLGMVNPLRYRAYVFDKETGLYYLQSRYYNPEIGRFINADALISTGRGVLGYNMFAYCRSNPVSRKDVLGTDEVDCFEADVDPTDNDEEWTGGRIGGGGNRGITAGGGSGGKPSGIPNGSRGNPYIGGTYKAGIYHSPTSDVNPEYQPPQGGGGVTNTIQSGSKQITFGHGGRRFNAGEYDYLDIEGAIAYDVMSQPQAYGDAMNVRIIYDGRPLIYRYLWRDEHLINVGSYFFEKDIR